MSSTAPTPLAAGRGNAEPPASWALRRGAVNALVALWAPVLFVVIWYAASAQSASPYFPPLSRVLAIIPRDFVHGPHFVGHVLPSLGVVLAGMAIATVVGVIGGYLIALNRFALDVTRPLIDAFRSVPAVALIPVAVVLLGPGQRSEIALVSLSALWPILLNTIAGVSGIEPTYWQVARMCRLSAWDRFWRVSLPAAAPAIMAGIHTSLALAVIVMVTMEMFSSTEGLGRYLMNAQRSFAIPVSYAGAIVVGIMGYGLSVAFTAAERVVLRWYFVRQGVFHARDR